MLKRKIRFKLRWVPREWNVHADALTNEELGEFDMNNRVEVKLEDLKFITLPTFLEESERLLRIVEEEKAKKKEPRGGGEVKEGSRRRRGEQEDPT